MKYDTNKNGLIRNIGHIGKYFRTTIEPNQKQYLNELITLPKHLQLA